jgi:hypothetical protein
VRQVLAACGLCLAASCLSERPRPAPPVLAIVIDSTSVRSTTPNDTLTGSVSAQDADGLDSIWLQVDSTRVGADGMLATTFQRPFRFAIRAGLPPTSHVPVVVEARDVLGFRSQLDTFVTVAP